jgi:hypothetical protein
MICPAQGIPQADKLFSMPMSLTEKELSEISQL